MFAILRKYRKVSSVPVSRTKPSRSIRRVEQMEDRVLPANPIVVTTASDVSDPNDGVTSLREAIDMANAVKQGQQRITFAPALQGKTITLDNTIGLEQNTVIDATGMNITITRNANLPNFRLFQQWDGVKSISTFIGLTLQGGLGNAGDKGGAIYGNGSALTVQNCTFVGNSADSGGAVAVLGGTLDVVNCTFENNNAVADDGGAIFLGSAVTVANVTNSYILFNTAAHEGGGIMIRGNTSNAAVTLNNVVVQNNQAMSNGAGICVDDANAPQLTLTGGTYIGYNTLTGANSMGGGLYLGDGTVTLSGVTFDTNTATTGTGIYAATGAQVLAGPGGVTYMNDECFEVDAESVNET